MDKNTFLLPSWLLSQNRQIKRGITLLFDLLIIELSLWFSFSLRLGEFFVPSGNVGYLFMVAPVLAIPIFIRLGLYRAIIRYIGFHSLWVVVKAVSLYILLLSLVVLLGRIELVPRSVHIINFLVVLLTIGGSRMIARWWLLEIPSKGVIKNLRKVVIYGAGSSGVQVFDQLRTKRDMKVVGFIDDELSLHNRQIRDIRVRSLSHLSKMIEREGVTDVLLAMPSVARSRRNQIITLLEPYSVKVKTLPSLAEIARSRWMIFVTWKLKIY